ncbi:hypothetical protein F4823DRAFT_186691 [Ustulina deusta]|nr:hypothetical protein F4823DRAFT_186691 [Ustulina deusta]
MADANPQRNGLDESAMTAAEEELWRRRERGKQSQARFRKRQAQASQETRAENEKMKAAIAEVVTATRSSDRLGLLRAVRAAADAAGVDASGLDEGDGEEAVEIGDRNAMVRASIEGDGPARAPEIRQTGSKSLVNQTCSDVSRSCSASTSGRMSPRLDYGLWIDPSRAVRVSKPPAEIIPFLGAGRYKFSGQLYWACTEYLVSLCRAVTTPHLPSPWFNCQPERRPTPREAEDRLWRILQHSPPIPSVRMAQALAEAVCEYRDCGYMQGDSPACTEGLCTLLREQVEAPYVERGMDLSVWMTVTDLERHVQQQLGSEAFSRLEKTITVCCTTNSSSVDREVRTVVRLLMKNLAESCTCFGDGPRWRADSISALFSEMRM